MQFNIITDVAKEKWSRFFKYELEQGNYIVQMYEDTDDTVGFLNKSDCIMIYDGKTKSLVALVERVFKKDFNIFQRFFLLRRGSKVKESISHGLEFFIYNRGEFIEYQVYKRWWYDIANDTGKLFEYVPK